MKFRYLGLFALAPVLSQCQPACAPIPEGDPVGENAPPPVEEVVPAPVETAAPVTVPATTPTTAPATTQPPVTTPPPKPLFEDDLTFGFFAEAFGNINCATSPVATVIGWNASATDAYFIVDVDAAILDGETGAVVRTLIHRPRFLPMVSDYWETIPNLPADRPYRTRVVATFTGPGMNAVTVTVYSDEWGDCISA